MHTHESVQTVYVIPTTTTIKSSNSKLSRQSTPITTWLVVTCKSRSHMSLTKTDEAGSVLLGNSLDT